MKTQIKPVSKQIRKRYSPEFKQQALARAARDGVAVAAKDLGLAESQLYAWRTKAKVVGQTSEEQRLQQSDHARLKREVARLEDWATSYSSTRTGTGCRTRANRASTA